MKGTLFLEKNAFLSPPFITKSLTLPPPLAKTLIWASVHSGWCGRTHCFCPCQHSGQGGTRKGLLGGVLLWDPGVRGAPAGWKLSLFLVGLDCGEKCSWLTSLGEFCGLKKINILYWFPHVILMLWLCTKLSKTGDCLRRVCAVKHDDLIARISLFASIAAVQVHGKLCACAAVGSCGWKWECLWVNGGVKADGRLGPAPAQPEPRWSSEI